MSGHQGRWLRGICNSCRLRGKLWTFDGRHFCRNCYNRAVRQKRGMRTVLIQ